jgi:hypothetical protein
MTTEQEINLVKQALVKYPKARKIAVENVTIGATDSMQFRMNLEMDCRLYNWNADTMKAIRWVMKNKK